MQMICSDFIRMLISQLRVMHIQQVDKILIGQISVDSKADWQTLQNMICDTFKVSQKMYCCCD